MSAVSVAVFGSSQASNAAPHYRLAESLGRALAKRGAIIRCGGYGGIMEGVAAGAKTEGGRVVGCTLRWFAEARKPNSFLDEVHESPDLHARVRCLLGGTRAAIVLPGGVGTLNELFWVWTLLMFDRDDGPQGLVLLGDQWKELMDFLSRRFEVNDAVLSLITIARDPEDAARLACGG
ncbi:MAG TPA: LOG family protein [Candidatus Eisenbacteria bacterium]|nr:LOG family protein [Candidatus Eisenbacteria bacterium]